MITQSIFVVAPALHRHIDAGIAAGRSQEAVKPLKKWFLKPEVGVARSTTHQAERTLGMATRFLEEVKDAIGRAAREGEDVPPRIRSVHEKPGHATPEFRTMAIPVGDSMEGASPEILSGTIARYAEAKRPDCLLLAMEAQMDSADGEHQTVLIAEARDRTGTRMYYVQPYRGGDSRVDWDEPVRGGWCDPGEDEMILDAAFPLRVEMGADLPRSRRQMMD